MPTKTFENEFQRYFRKFVVNIGLTQIVLCTFVRNTYHRIGTIWATDEVTTGHCDIYKQNSCIIYIYLPY